MNWAAIQNTNELARSLFTELSLYLLRVSFGVRQLGGHMEHDLLIMETGVDGLCPRLAVSDIQAAPESGEEMEKGKNWVCRESREAEREKGREKVASKNERRHNRKDEQSGIRSGTPECAPLRAPGQFTLIHHREDAKGTAAAHSITVSAAPPMPTLSESPFFRDSPFNQ